MSWNKNSAKVIGITAAAAMALSLAPATAFTAYAAPRNGSSVSEQAASSKTAFENGSLAAATVDGKSVSVKNNAVNFEFNGKRQIFTPTVIDLADGTTLSLKIISSSDTDTDLIGSDGLHYTLQNAEFEGLTNNETDTLTRHNPDGTTSVLNLHVTVSPTDLKGVVAESTNNLTYNTQPQQVSFYKDGVKLVKGTDYNVYFYKDAGHNTPLSSDAITDAGTYYAELRGLNNYGKDGNKVTELTVTMKPLDLSQAKVANPDLSGDVGEPGLLSGIDVNGVSGTALHNANDAQLTFGSGPEGNHSFMNIGAYTYTLSPTANSKNVVNSATLHFNKVNTVIGVDSGRFTYNGSQFSNDNNSPATIDLGTDPASRTFDASKVVVNTGSTPPTLPASDYNITVEKKQGNNWVSSSVSDMNSVAGDYRVRVVVDASKTSYNFGGNSGYRYVATGYNAAAYVYVKVNDKSLGHGWSSQTSGDIYNGKEFPVDIRVVARGPQNKAVLKQGTDYTVQLQKAPFSSVINNFTNVDKILDAGRYQITIKPMYKNLYFFDEHATPQQQKQDTTTYWVAPRPVSATRFSNTLAYYAGGQHFAYENGNAIVPVPVFKDNDGKTWDVPSADYVLSYAKDGKAVDALTDEGKYDVYINDVSLDDNFQITNSTPVQVAVTSTRYYEDVPNSSYYTNAVYDILGIMNGYNGTRDFGPFNHLQRYQASVVLFNIARRTANGSGIDETHVLEYDRNHVVKSPFKDLKLNKGDTRAVAWAAANGIVTGYGAHYSENNLFRPYQNVSRQEFALMLQRYASKLQGYKTGSADAVAAFPDASAVADWAKAGVDWAVSNKVITGLHGEIRPNDPIFRADTAMMVQRFLKLVPKVAD